MLLFVKQCTLGNKIRCAVALRLILEAFEGTWIELCYFPSHRVWLEVKVSVFRFSWGLACMRHVIMTLWVLSPGVPLCLSSSLLVYYVSEMRKEYSKMSWICSVFSSVGLRQPNHRVTQRIFDAFDQRVIDPHWKPDPSCWVISSVLERTQKYLTHRWVKYWIQISRWLKIADCVSVEELQLSHVYSSWNFAWMKKSQSETDTVRIKFRFSVHQLIDSSFWSRPKYLNNYRMDWSPQDDNQFGWLGLSKTWLMIKFLQN